jgi:hypothetical protein
LLHLCPLAQISHRQFVTEILRMFHEWAKSFPFMPPSEKFLFQAVPEDELAPQRVEPKPLEESRQQLIPGKLFIIS